MGHEREPILIGPQGKESRSAGIENSGAFVNGVGGRAVASVGSADQVVDPDRAESRNSKRTALHWVVAPMVD